MARREHSARRALLENRSQESVLVGALLQRVGMQVPDQMAMQRVELSRQPGPDGEPYWDAQLDGLVLGSSRAESQALFNQFFARLAADPIVHDMHLVEPLVIGAEEARTLPLYARDPQSLFPPQSQFGADDGISYGGGEPQYRTTLDDLPPFGLTETAVGFKILAQLKALQTGGSQ